MPDVTDGTDDRVAVTGTVSGRVQGVGFRMSAEWRARALRLVGWVRNVPDGRVEVFAQGPPAQVEEFEHWLAVGPPAARVESVHLTSVPTDPNLTSFTVRP